MQERYGSQILDFIDRAKKVEILETKQEFIYAIDGRILFIEKNNLIFPTVKMIQEEPKQIKLPEIVVDMGAVPFVCRGAMIMRPGIVAFCNTDQLKKDQIVQVTDEKNRIVIAIGKLRMDGTEMKQKQKGPAIENLAWVGDAYWNLSI